MEFISIFNSPKYGLFSVQYEGVNTDEFESEALFDSVTELVSKVPVILLLNRRDDHIDDIMTVVKKQFAEL